MTLCGTFPLNGLLISLEVAPLSKGNCHFCVDHGILGWSFGHSKHQFIVDRGVECDQAEVEGKLNVFWAYPDCLVR